MLVNSGHFWGVDKLGEISLPFDKSINFIVQRGVSLDLSTDSLTEKFNFQKQEDSKYFGAGY